jgi:hypothetical protein
MIRALNGYCDSAPLFWSLSAEGNGNMHCHITLCAARAPDVWPRRSVKTITLLRCAARCKEAAAHRPGVRAWQEHHPCTPELSLAAISFVDLTTTTTSPSPFYPLPDIHPQTCLPPIPRKPGSVSRQSSRAARRDSVAAVAELPRVPSADSQVLLCSVAVYTSRTMRFSTVSRSGGSSLERTEGEMQMELC